MHKTIAIWLVLITGCITKHLLNTDKPTLYLIGDSTVATGSKDAAIQGWGGLLYEFLDTTKIVIQNRAVSGTSSRTYYTGVVHDRKMTANGMWAEVLASIKKGDFVIMQFGHNDESPITDTSRCRGTIKGIGDDTVKAFNKFLNRDETVHSYGWYIEQFILEAKSRGAIPLVCSPIPKNRWQQGHIERSNLDYGKWAKEIAVRNNVAFIDLNQLGADAYDAEGKEKVSKEYFVGDNVHTTRDGAIKHATLVAKAIAQLPSEKLARYLQKNN